MSRASRDLVIRLLGDTSKFAQSLRGASNDATRFGGRLTRTLTPVAAGVAAGMTAIGTSFNEARNNIIAGTGATGSALAGLMDDTRAVGRQVPISFGDAGAAVANLNTRLGLTGVELQDAAVQVSKFARIFGLDIGTATNDVGRLMNALGIGPEGLNGLLDKLTFASQASGIEVSKLIGFIVEAGPAFEELGFGLDESIALFAQFEAAGARPEELIGSLNLVMTRMAREGITDAREGFALLVQRIQDAPDILTATGIAADAFGARVGGKVAEDIRAGRFEIDDFVAALQGSDGVVSDSSDAMLTLSDRLVMLRNRVIGALGPFGELGGAAAGVVAGVGPLIFGIGAMIPLLAKLRTGIVQLGVAMKAHPVLLLAGVLAGVAVAFSSARDGADNFRQKMLELAQAIEEFGRVEAFRQVISQFVEDTPELSESMREAGVSVEALTSAMLHGGAPLDLIRSKIEATGESFDVWGRNSTIAVLETDKLMASFDELIGIVEGGNEAHREHAAELAATGTGARNAERRAIGLTRAQRDATESTEDLTEALEDERKALEEATRAADDQVRAVDSLADAQRASEDAVFAHRRAQQSFRDQTQTTTKALNDQKLSAEEQQIALDDLTVSAGRVADSAVQIAEKQAEARGATLSGSDATRIYNESLAASAAQLQGPQRRAILDYIANINNIPPERVSEIEALLDQGSVDEAARLINDSSRTREAQIRAEADQSALQQTERDLANLLRERRVLVRPHLLSGTLPAHIRNPYNRHVGGRVSQGQMVQPLSGETFVPDQPGRIMSREDTARMLDDQGGRSGGVTMNVTVNNPRSEDDVRRGVQRALVLAELAS